MNYVLYFNYLTVVEKNVELMEYGKMTNNFAYCEKCGKFVNFKTIIKEGYNYFNIFENRLVCKECSKKIRNILTIICKFMSRTSFS